MREYAALLLAFINRMDETDRPPAMPCRPGLHAAGRARRDGMSAWGDGRSMAELVSKLKHYLSGESRIEGLFTGKVGREEETLSVLADEDMARND